MTPPARPSSWVGEQVETTYVLWGLGERDQTTARRIFFQPSSLLAGACSWFVALIILVPSTRCHSDRLGYDQKRTTRVVRAARVGSSQGAVEVRVTKRGSGTGQWGANIVKFSRAGDRFGTSWGGTHLRTLKVAIWCCHGYALWDKKANSLWDSYCPRHSNKRVKFVQFA